MSKSGSKEYGKAMPGASPPAPPSWAKCCANPLLQYTGLPYPGFPGCTVCDLPTWEKHCATSEQFGNCSFLGYSIAQRPDGHHAPASELTAPIPGTTCPGSASDPIKLEQSYLTDNGVICFDNRKDSNDRLCIFKDFKTAGVNAEQIGSPAAATSVLTTLIQGAGMDQQVSKKSSMDGKRVCLHYGDQASVGWTHMHVFDPKVTPMPDGVCDYLLTPDKCTKEKATAYCADYNNGATSTAATLVSHMQQRGKQQPKTCANPKPCS
jgi:hypothetical protein